MPGKYLPLKELQKRLEQLGFSFRPTDTAHSFLAVFKRPPPLQPISINPASKDYEKQGWDSVRQDIQRQDNDLMTFLYKPDFQIPPNLNMTTLKLDPKQQEEIYEYKQIPFASIPVNAINNNMFQIQMGSEWYSNIADIDYETKTLMTPEGNLYSAPSLNTMFTIRKEKS